MVKNKAYDLGYITSDGYEVVDYGYWAAKAQYKQLYYLCRHSCGQERKFLARQVDVEKQPCKKCMARKDYRKESHAIIVNVEYNKYKHNAKKRNYEFALSKKEFEDIVIKPCTYCRREPFTKKSMPSGRKYEWHEDSINLNGIDRIDNTKGYVIDNVTPCCFVCNKAKSIMSIEEWIEMVKLWNDSLKYLTKGV